MKWWRETIPKPVAVYLIIGNGFDLELGLPTRYEDYLHFLELVERRISAHAPETEIEISEEIRKCLEEKPSKTIWKPVIENFWYRHFRNISIQSNWIDFENEIARIIKTIEFGMDHSRIRELTMEDNVVGDDEDLTNALEEILCSYDESNRFVKDGRSYVEYDLKYRELRDQLEEQLASFIQGFETYLRDYVEKIKISTPQSILNLLKHFGACENRYVISFNYTKRIESILKAAGIDADICYIHGKIGEKGKKNTMVLGMDEYLSEEKLRNRTGFAGFRKYNQRIIKATDSRYIDWLEDMNIGGNFSRMTLVYGHSLGLTDREIIESFVTKPGMRTAIYYHNEDHLNLAVTNLTAIISKNEMIKRTGGKNHTIEFRNQYD